MAKEMMKDVNNAAANSVSNLKAKAEASPIYDDLETIKEDIRVLKNDTKVLGRDLKDEGYKQLSAAEIKAREALEAAREKGKDQYAEISRFVQNNPGQSLAIAFVGGIIASMILGRRG